MTSSSQATALEKQRQRVRRYPHLRRRALAAADVTKVLGLSRKHASALARSRLDGFTAERLMVLLTRLGFDIDIVVHESPAPAGYTGRIDVRGGAPRR